MHIKFIGLYHNKIKELIIVAELSRILILMANHISKVLLIPGFRMQMFWSDLGPYFKTGGAGIRI